MEAVRMEDQMEQMQKLMHHVFVKMNNFHPDHHTTDHHGLQEEEEEDDDESGGGCGGIVIPPFPSDNGRRSGGGSEAMMMGQSPSSWETTMYSLAKELETICSRGSSPRDSPNLLSPCVTPTNGMTPAAAMTMAQSPTRSQRTVSLASGQLPHQGSLCGSGGDSSPGGSYPSPPGARQVRVRHEETEDRLDRSLTMICRQNSPQAMRFFYGDQTHATILKDSSHKRGSAALRYRDSAKYGIRFRLDLGDRDLDNITVSINADEHILRVYDDGEPIHLLQLAENTNPQTLSCTIIDAHILFVKQTSREAVCLEYEGGSEVNLPVTRQDECLLTTTITLRIPSNVSADEVSVKTIDDTLMIRTGGGSTSDETPGAGGGGTTTGSTPGQQFWVALALPEGTDTRSVCAWMTKSHLTVKGRLMPTSRRMTCAF